MKFDVITIGGATEDIFIRSKEAVVAGEEGVDEKLCFPYGVKINVEPMTFEIGGGGCNAAVALSRLGKQVGFVGKIGDDESGGEILRRLAEQGVDARFVVRSKQNSGVSVILSGPTGDRTALLDRGANSSLTAADIDFEALEEVSWLYVAHLSGDSDKVIPKIFEVKKRKKGVQIAWNPGAKQIEQGIGVYEKVVELVDVIFVNREEACQFLGMSDGACPTPIDEWSAADMRPIFELFGKWGISKVIVSDGRRGAQAWDGEKYYLSRSAEEESVDNLGAGDAYFATFVAGQIDGLGFGESMQRALANVDSVIKKIGAQNGLLAIEEMGTALKITPETSEIYN